MLSQLIKDLESIYKEYGDLEVTVNGQPIVDEVGACIGISDNGKDIEFVTRD